MKVLESVKLEDIEETFNLINNLIKFLNKQLTFKFIKY